MSSDARSTMRDVALGAGVAINTVSRVVKQRPDVHPAELDERRVPDDAVVGYDDTSYAPYLHVSLTPVPQPTADGGIAAARRLLERQAGDAGPPQRLVLSPRLIVRASTSGVR